MSLIVGFIDNSEHILELNLWFDELREEGEIIGALFRDLHCDSEFIRSRYELQLCFFELERELIIMSLGYAFSRLEFKSLKPRIDVQEFKWFGL